MLILLYHRVAELSRDPYRLAVSPRNFADHVAWLRQRFALVPLDSVRKHERGARVAITFDDGYHDAAGAAREILEAASAPATVFVVAGMVGADREFWWDRLEHLILDRWRPRASIEVRVGGRRLWADTRSPEGRARAHVALYRRLRLLPLDEIERLLNEFSAEVDGNGDMRETHRPVTAAEVRALGASRVIEVGAHTVRHHRLTQLPAGEREREIVESRKRLEELTGRSVWSFSYPHGDFDQRTIEVVKRAGFALACSSLEGLASGSADRFRLPRQVVLDWGRAEFARRVDAWFAG